MTNKTPTDRPRILLVMPEAGIHHLRLGRKKISFREAPLTLTTLAALVPPEINADITVIDESIQRVPFERAFDLVGISCMTGTAFRAYEIADEFRRQGSVVVLGGVHVSLRPEEARGHADTLIHGFAEISWPTLLRDWANGELLVDYHIPPTTLAGLPLPRRDLQKRRSYMIPNTVFATRGCKRSCEFCTVAAIPFGWQTRPVGDVIDEIRQIPSRRIAFNDVSIAEDREYAKELFTAMIPLGKKWGGLATLDITHDDELLALMHRSGCVYLLIGFESLGRSSLAGINKSFNRTDEYKRAIAKLHAHGIMIQGCFIFGLDQDDPTVFEQTVAGVNDLKIDIPRFAIYTPYPGTLAFSRLKTQGRILHEHWPHYDTQHVVFQPAQMTPEELDRGFRKAYEDAFTIGSIHRRTFGKKNFPISFIGNLAYRKYIRRLKKDPQRLFSTEGLVQPCPM